MSQIDFDHLHKRYAAHLPDVIKDAHFRVDAGEFCVFVGPSGCGKSTMLRMIAGLEDITSGQLSIAGKMVNALPPAERGVAMVFQSYALYPHMTVAQNMSFGLQMRGVSKAEIETKVRTAAQTLQLEPLLDRLPKQLSGGQRQRVAIGRAIVKNPQVFLFDEPLSNLDAALRVQTRIEIAKLHKSLGSASTVYVTHDQVEAMTLADKIVLLHSGDWIAKHGSIAQVGSPMQLYHRPRSLFVAQFIGSPKMNILPAHLSKANEDLAQVKVADATIDLAVKALHLPADSAVKLGIRPEHLRIVNADGAAHIKAKITHIEKLGDSSILYAMPANSLATDALVVKTEGYAKQQVGEVIGLAFPAEDLHLFDAAGLSCERSVELPA